MLAKYFSIVGYSGSGKTYLIEKIIQYLVKKDYKVGICKNIHHSGFGIDVPDKDTTKYYENGAKIVSYVAPNSSGIIKIEDNGMEETFENIETKVDYLILEGFKDIIGVPTIALIKEKSDLERFLTDYTINLSSHLIDLSSHELYAKIDDIPSIVEKKALPPMPGLNCKKCGYPLCKEFYKNVIKGKEEIKKCVNLKINVRLLVNGNKIPINSFVSEIFRNVLIGLVESLQIPDEDIKSIEITYKI